MFSHGAHGVTFEDSQGRGPVGQFCRHLGGQTFPLAIHSKGGIHPPRGPIPTEARLKSHSIWLYDSDGDVADSWAATKGL